MTAYEPCFKRFRPQKILEGAQSTRLHESNDIARESGKIRWWDLEHFGVYLIKVCLKKCYCSEVQFVVIWSKI